jgi:hypothetical protein
MKTNNKPTRPLYRVTFSPFSGQDENGKPIVGRPKEIGAVWPRKEGKTGGIISLDIIPVELTQRQGVLFLLPINQQESSQ